MATSLKKLKMLGASNQTLTQNWVAYATEIWDFGATKVTYYLEAKYSEQSQTNNNTTIQTRLRAELNYGYGSGFGYNFTCSYALPVSGTNEWYLASEVITSGEATIPHENDGTKTITLNATATVNGLGKSSNLSATVDLPPIDRQSELVEKPVFTMSTDGSSMTFKVNVKKNNPNFYDILKITSSDGQIIIKQVDGITAGEHTYTFTEQERNRVFQAYGTNTREILWARLNTWTSQGGTDLGYGTNGIRSANYIDLVYTISTTATMTETVTSLNTYKPSGHTNDTFIANLSKPQFALTTTSSTGSFYGRSVTYKLNNNIITSPYTENSYTGQNFTFNVTDGRENTSVTPSFTNIAYFKPTLTTTIKRTSPTGSTANITVSGTLYDGTGLTNLETPNLTFKYTESGGTEQTIQIPLTINGNNFTGSATISGLNYQKSVTWSSILTDRLGITANNGNTLPQGLPVYHCYRDSNNNNFMNIYGSLLINGKPINYYVVGEEVIIGYFKNGNKTKPIYRKVCYISALPSSIGTTEKYDVNISNADFIVNCYGSCSNGNLINASRCDGASAEIGAWYDTDRQRLTMTVGRDRSSLSAYITVEYTKSTD